MSWRWYGHRIWTFFWMSLLFWSFANGTISVTLGLIICFLFTPRLIEGWGNRLYSSKPCLYCVGDWLGSLETLLVLRYEQGFVSGQLALGKFEYWGHRKRSLLNITFQGVLASNELISQFSCPLYSFPHNHFSFLQVVQSLQDIKHQYLLLLENWTQCSFI
jgi:hypothetical protein